MISIIVYLLVCCFSVFYVIVLFNWCIHYVIFLFNWCIHYNGQGLWSPDRNVF